MKENRAIICRVSYFKSNARIHTHTLAHFPRCVSLLLLLAIIIVIFFWVSFIVRPCESSSMVCSIWKRIRLIFSAYKTYKWMFVKTSIHVYYWNGNSYRRIDLPKCIENGMSRRVTQCLTTNASTHTHTQLPHKLRHIYWGICCCCFFSNPQLDVISRVMFKLSWFSLCYKCEWYQFARKRRVHSSRAHYFHRFAINFSLRSILFQI